MTVVAVNVKETIDDAFESVRSPLGGGWRPLTETTKQINPRRDGGTPLLDTGRLRGSITTSVAAGGMRFGTNVIYAATQQFGRSDNKVFGKYPGPIPARPFLPITQDGRQLAPDSFWDRQRRMIEHWIVTGDIVE